MKIFNFKKKEKNETFQINDQDREWVDTNFLWLVKVLGSPKQYDNPILFSDFSSINSSCENIDINYLIKEISSFLEINHSKISYEYFEDIRDIANMPYEIEGESVDADIEIISNKYIIHIAKSLLRNKKRLLYKLVYNLIRIKLFEKNLVFDTNDDTSPFIHIAGIYFGVGIIISQNLVDIGENSDGFWQFKWNHIADIPYNLFIYGLALYIVITETNPVNWENNLPSELKSELKKALNYIIFYPSVICNREEILAADLSYQSYTKYLDKEYDVAISKANDAVLTTNDDQFKAEIFNQLGYIFLRKGELKQSIKFFQQSLDKNPNFGIAYDNLGYVHILLGILDVGIEYLEKASLTGNNDVAYNLRNHALYHIKMGDRDLAKSAFENAFDSITDSVDLLEYYYSEFLFDEGKYDEGMVFLSKAVEKGEDEAINRMNELKERNYL